MTLLNAIIEVLSTVKKPLHVIDIYQEVTDMKLWQTTGKTPTATIGACLYSDIKNNGDESQFVKVKPNVFAMREFYDTSEQNHEGNPVDIENQTSDAGSVAEGSTEPISATSSMSFNDCAQKVLESFGDKKPMHYRDITLKALEKGWLVTKGKTPEFTMNAQVITEIKRQQSRGEVSRFVQHGRGYIGLSKWQAQGLSFQIDQYNQKVRKTLRDRLLVMKPKEFEELISQLLAEMGFVEVELGSFRADGGIDVRGELTVGDVVRLKLAVQVKRWKRNVQAPVVRDVRGSLGAHEQGLIITTSDFGKGAREEAAQPDKSPIALMNGEQLVLLLLEHGIGVQCSTPNLFEIDEESSVWNEA